jgi:hypothetical protein
MPSLLSDNPLLSFNSLLPDDASNKANELLDKLNQKKVALGKQYVDYDNLEVVDGDTVHKKDTGEQFRLQFDKSGYSIDPYETNHGDIFTAKEDTQKKLARQRQYLLEQTNKDKWFDFTKANPEDITNEMIFAKGEEAKQRLNNALKGKKGIELNTWGEDIFHRGLTDIRLDGSQDSLLSEINTPELNTGYNQKYNSIQKLKDSLNKNAVMQDVGDIATNIASRTVGLTGLPAELIDMGSGAVTAIANKLGADLNEPLSYTKALADGVEIPFTDGFRVGFDPNRAAKTIKETLQSNEAVANEVEYAKRKADAIRTKGDELSFGEEFGLSMKFMGDHPKYAIDAVAESIPDFFLMGAAAKRVAGKVAETALKEAGLTITDVGAKDVLATAYKANKGRILGASALSEGIISAGSDYQGLIDEGVKSTKAALPSIAAGAAVSLINLGLGHSPLGDAITKFVTKDASNAAKETLKGALTKTLVSVGSESIEEGLQSPAETILTNVAREKANLLEGAGYSAAEGTVSGGILGGGMTASHTSLDALKSSLNARREAKQEELAKATANPMKDATDALNSYNSVDTPSPEMNDSLVKAATDLGIDIKDKPINEIHDEVTKATKYSSVEDYQAIKGMDSDTDLNEHITKVVGSKVSNDVQIDVLEQLQKKDPTSFETRKEELQPKLDKLYQQSTTKDDPNLIADNIHTSKLSPLATASIQAIDKEANKLTSKDPEVISKIEPTLLLEHTARIVNEAGKVDLKDTTTKEEYRNAVNVSLNGYWVVAASTGNITEEKAQEHLNRVQRTLANLESHIVNNTDMTNKEDINLLIKSNYGSVAPEELTPENKKSVPTEDLIKASKDTTDKIKAARATTTLKLRGVYSQLEDKLKKVPGIFNQVIKEVFEGTGDKPAIKEHQLLIMAAMDSDKLSSKAATKTALNDFGKWINYHSEKQIELTKVNQAIIKHGVDSQQAIDALVDLNTWAKSKNVVDIEGNAREYKISKKNGKLKFGNLTEQVTLEAKAMQIAFHALKDEASAKFGKEDLPDAMSHLLDTEVVTTPVVSEEDNSTVQTEEDLANRFNEEQPSNTTEPSNPNKNKDKFTPTHTLTNSKGTRTIVVQEIKDDYLNTVWRTEDGGNIHNIENWIGDGWVISKIKTETKSKEESIFSKLKKELAGLKAYILVDILSGLKTFKAIYRGERVSLLDLENEILRLRKKANKGELTKQDLINTYILWVTDTRIQMSISEESVKNNQQLYVDMLDEIVSSLKESDFASDTEVEIINVQEQISANESFGKQTNTAEEVELYVKTKEELKNKLASLKEKLTLETSTEEVTPTEEAKPVEDNSTVTEETTQSEQDTLQDESEIPPITDEEFQSMYDSYQEEIQDEESNVEPLTAKQLQSIFNNIIGLIKANKIATTNPIEMASKILTHLFKTDLSLSDVKDKMENYILPGINDKTIKDNTNKDYLFGLELGREEANNKFLEWQDKRLNELANAKTDTQEANPDVNPEFFKEKLNSKGGKFRLFFTIKGSKKYIPFIKVESPIKNVTNLVPLETVVDSKNKELPIKYYLFNKFVNTAGVGRLYSKALGLLKDSTKETVFTKYPDLFRNLENNVHIISQLKSIEGKVAIDTIAEFVEQFHNEYVKANTKISDTIDRKKFTSEVGKKFSKDIQAQLAVFNKDNSEVDLNVEALLKHFEGNSDVTRFINKFAKVLLNVESNPSLLLHNDDEVIDRNITAQLALHALSWMINTGTKTLYTEREMTLHMLGKEEATAPSDEAMAALSTMGLVRGYVANQMSGSIVNYMGFKPNDYIPKEMFPKFETALGLSAIDTLERMGYVEYKGIPQASMNAFMTGEDTVSRGYTSESSILKDATIFVRIKSDLAKNNEPILVKHVRELFDKVRPGNKEIQDIFSIELVETEYSATPWERSKLLQMLGERNGILTFGNSRTQYAKDDRKAALNGAKSAFDNRTAANDLANKLGDEFLKEINFEKKLDAEDHIGNIESNKGLLSSTMSMLDSWKELNSLGAVVYFYYKKMYQGRYQGVGSGHPQTNKLVRWTRSLWKGEVKKDYSDPVFKQFMQAVIEGFKKKPSQMTDAEIQDSFIEIYEKHIPVLNLINEDTLTEEEKDTIVQAIHAGGEKYHTMAVLAALSEYHSTIGDTFTTTLMREIDGITNGPLISLIMMSGVKQTFFEGKPVAVHIEELQAGGVSITGESYLDFVKNNPDTNDMYKIVARYINIYISELNETLPLIIREGKNRFLKDVRTPLQQRIAIMDAHPNRIEPQVWLNAVHNLVGIIDRGFAKNPTTVFIFGGSTIKIAANVASKVLFDINNKLLAISKIEDEVTQLDAVKELHANLFNSIGLPINLLTEYTKAPNKKTFLLNWQLTKPQKTILRNSVIATYTPVIDNAVKTVFARLLENRKLVNNVYQLTNKIFKHEFERKIDELVKQGITITAEDIDNILLELQPLMPDIAIFNAEDIKEQRLQLWKPESAKQGKADYKVQINSPKDSKPMTMMGLDEQGNVFESYIINEGTDNEIEIHVPQSASAYAKDMIIAAMSVRAPITSTHNADSHVIQQLLKLNQQVLGIHDASMMGLDRVEEVSRGMNEALFNLLANYNYFNEVYKHLERVKSYNKKNINSWFNGTVNRVNAKAEGLLSEVNEEARPVDITREIVGSWNTVWVRDPETRRNVQRIAYNSFDEFIAYFKDKSEELYKELQDNVITPIKQGGSFGNYSGQYPFVPVYTPTGSTEEQIVSIIESGLNQGNTNTKPEIKPSESNEIYSQLGNKTKSTNVVITSWSNLKGVTKAITPNGVVATRIYNSNEHFGNPFSHDPAGKTQGLIQTETIQEAVERYIDWVINSSDIRANWIRAQLQSGVLKGKPILYYKELGEPSHATALDYLINKYDWGNKPSEDTSTKVGFTLKGKPGIYASLLRKDQGKANIVNAYIGYGIKGSSTEAYLNDAQGNVPTNESINPTKDTIAFVSINGNKQLTPENKTKTLEQIKRVLNAGGVIVMDNSRIANSIHNKSGEGVIQQEIQSIPGIGMMEVNGNNQYKMINTSTQTNEDNNFVLTKDKIQKLKDFINKYINSSDTYKVSDLIDKVKLLNPEFKDLDILKYMYGSLLSTYYSDENQKKDFNVGNKTPDMFYQHKNYWESRKNYGLKLVKDNQSGKAKIISINNNPNLGSQESTTTNLFQNPLGNIDSTNVLDTAERLENLGNVRDEDTHTTHLKSILGGFISKVLQPLQYFEMTSPEANIGEYDPSGKIGLNISNAPIAPTVKVPMSALTTFVHELVHGVTASALFDPKNSILRSRVQKIFNHIERNISNEDKEKYSHIFANKNKTQLANGTFVNHGLAELIAFAETEPMFRELLNSLPKMTVGKITETWDESKEKFIEANLLEIISNVFNKIMVWWNDKIKGEHSTDVLTQLHTLTVQLSTAHLKAKSTIYDFKLLSDKSDNFVLNKLHRLLVEPLLKLLGNNYFTLNPNKNAAAMSNSARDLLNAPGSAKAKVDKLFEFTDIMKKNLNISEEHWLTYSLNEITGQIAVGNFTQALNMTKKLRDKVVAIIQNTISSNLRAGFKTNLTKQLDRVVYNTLLKTDLSSLQDYYKDDLLNMFDGSKRKVEQEKLKKEILNNKNGKLYLGHTYNTAFFMVHNQATKSFQHSTLMNATQIYNMYGSNFKPVGDKDSTVELIDKLIGLYTLDLVNQEELNTLKDLFNTDSHGLNMSMEVHRQQKEHHLNDILKGNKSLVVKGSTKELTNPNRQIIIATAAEEEKLKLNHYTKGNKIVYEGKELYVYHSKFRLMQPWVQGIISYTHMNNILSDMKGVMKQSDGLDQIIQDGKLDASAKIKTMKENEANANKTVFDTTEADYTLNPVFNGKGYVSKHSFMLSNQDKENLLDMNTNFTHVLGAMVANITDKLNTQRLNDESAKMLIKNRMDNLETKGIQWITLSKDAKTKNERDIWNKLTPEFKKTILDLSGSNEVVVNAKLLKMIFGQRKLSLSDFFRPADEQELSTFVKYFGSQLYPYIKKVNLDRGTQIWQEGIGYLKDQLVVKSGTVLGGNEVSNAWIAYMEGMTLIQYFKAKIEALRLVIGYHKLQSQINDIEYLLKYDKEMSSTMRTNLETKLSNISSLANNSLVKKYDIAGQMKTIVDEIGEDENLWSFRNEVFENRIKSVTDKLPKPIKTIGREVFMTHDTKMYQLMRDLTQMSDLTSRIAVGEFKQSHGMTEKEALQLVDEAFINYDIPSHQNVQFAADMGLFMFNKFFFRIQSVIAREVGQHPARFLTLLGMEQVFGAQEAIHHSLMTPDELIGHVSNPLKLPYAIWDSNFYNWLFSFHAPVYQPV